MTVIYNNVPYNQELTTAWGMSCLIEGLEKTILFDTGGDGAVLLANMAKLGIDPMTIDTVVLSHIHSDHTGGLWDLLEKNSRVIVYVLESFPKDFKNRVEHLCGKVISVREPIEIGKDVWSTGELGAWMKEQSLVIDTKKGLIIITGCAHPGIVDIVKFTREHFQQDVYLVFGGFHLMAYSERQVTGIISDLKKMGVGKVGPSHCTGEKQIDMFRNAWGKDFIELGCGAKLEINTIEPKEKE